MVKDEFVKQGRCWGRWPRNDWTPTTRWIVIRYWLPVGRLPIPCLC